MYLIHYSEFSSSESVTISSLLMATYDLFRVLGRVLGPATGNEGKLPPAAPVFSVSQMDD